MLPNVIAFNMLRNNHDDVDVNLGNTLPMASATNVTWIHHVQDKSWSTAISIIEAQHWIHWYPHSNHLECHISSIQSDIMLHEHTMKSLFGKHSYGSYTTSISHREGLQILSRQAVVLSTYGPINHP